MNGLSRLPAEERINGHSAGAAAGGQNGQVGAAGEQKREAGAAAGGENGKDWDRRITDRVAGGGGGGNETEVRVMGNGTPIPQPPVVTFTQVKPRMEQIA